MLNGFADHPGGSISDPPFFRYWINDIIEGMGDCSRCLRDELAVNIGKTVMLGVRSSFFFIGPAEEALRELKTAGMMVGLCVALSSHKRITRQMIDKASADDIGSRRVVKTYARSGEDDDDVVIIIEGKEFGSFWTREEYLAARHDLASILESTDL